MKTEKISALIMDFMSNRAEHTQSNYWSVIRRFCYAGGVPRYSDQRKPSDTALRFLAKADRVAALSYITYMRTHKLPDGTRYADKTIGVHFGYLRKLYRYFEYMKVTRSNPWEEIKYEVSFRQRHAKRPTKVIPMDKVSELLDSPNPETRAGVRDRAMLAIMFGGALRRSEVRTLLLSDVHVAGDGTLYLHLRNPKSGKEQNQPLPEWAWDRFSKLVSQRKADGAKDSDPIFVRYDERRESDHEMIGMNAVHRYYRRYSQRLGIDMAAPHSARKTAATMAAVQGATEAQLAQLLRHANIGRVQIYVQLARGMKENPACRLEYPRKVA